MLNGLVLTPTFDKLFDSGFTGFDESWDIKLSNLNT